MSEALIFKVASEVDARLGETNWGLIWGKEMQAVLRMIKIYV